MMSMEGESSWEDIAVRTGIFDVKAHLTVQILKALNTFQQVDKYSFATRISNREYDMHPRSICHSDLHVDNILLSKSADIYKPNITDREIAEIKVVIIDFGKGIIVKNRFETYKDYFDADNLLKKLWYGEDFNGNENCWNEENKEYLWLLPDNDKENQNVENQKVNNFEKLELMQTLLSEFTKIKKGLQKLYEENCESSEFRKWRKERRRIASGAGTASVKGGYSRMAGPRVLLDGEQLSDRVDEKGLMGYKDVLGDKKLSLKYLSEIISDYQKNFR